MQLKGRSGYYRWPKRVAALSPLLWQFTRAKRRKHEYCADDLVKSGPVQSLLLWHS
jgi:hypothetical protein